MNPDAPLALRLSGQLMLGVVRIYSRKVNYLFQDCSEALVKIKQAFKPGGRDDVDLPEGAETAPLGAITLPENYDDLELFFEPGGAFGAQATTHPSGSGGEDDGRERADDDITLERANPFEEDDFDRFYAYDDRVHGDVGDDDAFIEDELDPRLHPEPGFRVGDGPRAYGESDPNERVDAEGVENYDAAAVDDDDAFGGGGAFDDGGASTPGGAPNANEDDAEPPPPLPLDDDLEDETGARGTVVGFKTPPAAERAGGKENAPAEDPNTASTAGVTAEWGKTAQKSKRPEGFAKRARRKRETMKIKFDAATMLSNERVKANIRDASDIVARRGAGACARVADAADDDAPTVPPPRGFASASEADRCFVRPDLDSAGRAAAAGGFFPGYFRERYASAPPPESAAEARAVLRGVAGGRDPLMGHRPSAWRARARATCVDAVWRRAGERWGAGWVDDPRERGGSAEKANSKGPRAALDFEDEDGGYAPPPDDDDGDFGGGGFDGEGDDFLGGGDDASRRRSDAARMTLDALGSEPPTPANAPSGNVDWSVATKRMLADIEPRLAASDAPPLTLSEMTRRKTGARREDGGAGGGDVDEERACDRGEAARIFYQVLVLQTHGFVETTQSEPHGEIVVAAGAKMRVPASA